MSQKERRLECSYETVVHQSNPTLVENKLVHILLCSICNSKFFPDHLAVYEAAGEQDDLGNERA